MANGSANRADSENMQVSDRLRSPRSALRRFFISNATREQLPSDLIARLVEIRTAGNTMFNLLRPYRRASVFSLRFSQGSYERALEEGASRTDRSVNMFKISARNSREALDLAAKNLIAKTFAKSKSKEQDVDTTSAVSALFFIAAVSKYGADIILETNMDPKEKQKLAKKFVTFYDENVSQFTDLGKKFKMDPRKFHETCYGIYESLKKSHPEFFSNLKEKLWTDGELMAPYGSHQYGHSWIGQHYAGNLG